MSETTAIKEKPTVLENKFRVRAGCVALFLIFIGLRLYHLGFHDFWYDEIGTIYQSTYPWNNFSAPFYWWFIHVWMKLFPISEFSLRFPSLLFSAFTVIFIYLIGRELFDRRVGLIAAVFAGLSPFQLWYAQEARSYSLVLFLCTLASYFLLLAAKNRKRAWWFCFVAVSVMAIFTNFLSMVLLFAQWCYFLVFRRKKIHFPVTLAMILICLGFTPYVKKFVFNVFQIWQDFWVPEPTSRSILITLENFLLGYNSMPILYPLSAALAALFVGSAFFRSRDKERIPSVAFCGFLCFIPVVFIFCFSKLFVSVYLDRGLIIFSPYYYVLLAFGALSMKRRARAPLILCMISIIIVSCYGFYMDWMRMSPAHHIGVCIKKPIKPAARYLKARLEPEDILIYTDPHLMNQFNYYLQFDSEPKEVIRCEPEGITIEDVQGDRFDLDRLELDRLWVICLVTERSLGAGRLQRELVSELTEKSRCVKAHLDEDLEMVEEKKFDGYWLYGYEE